MTTVIIVLLTANLAFFAGWFSRDVRNKLTYVYYKIKASSEKVSFGSARPQAKEERPIGNIIAAAKTDDTQVVRRMTPKMIRIQKDQRFRDKHNL